MVTDKEGLLVSGVLDSLDDRAADDHLVTPVL